jgi:hypothetical protein
MKKLAFLPTVSVFALAAGFAGGALGQACSPDAVNCLNVKVTVQGNQISLDPATVTVTPRAAPAVKIVWYLATPGYRFVDQTGDRPVNFPAAYFMSNDARFCYPWTSNTVYVCTDWNADTFAWGTDYTLKVQAVSGASPSPASGRVVNN